MVWAFSNASKPQTNPFFVNSFVESVKDSVKLELESFPPSAEPTELI